MIVFLDGKMPLSKDKEPGKGKSPCMKLEKTFLRYDPINLKKGILS